MLLAAFFRPYLFALVPLLFFQTTCLQAAAQEESQEMKERLALGKKDSPIEIYVVSDWFCSSCKKLEPKLEALYPALSSQATFFFVDYAINRQSVNFSPYHLAFLIHEKGNYLKARQALSKLTETTQAPNDEEIANLAKTNGLNFQDLSFADIQAGTAFFEEIAKRYQIHATPTVIVSNSKTGQFETFKGSQIQEKNIAEAIKRLKEGPSAKPKKSKKWKWFPFFN